MTILRKKDKLLNLIKIVPVGSVVFISIILILVAIFGIHKYFDEESQKLEKSIINKKIKTSQQRLNSLEEIAHHVDKSVIEFSKSQVKLVVNLGYELVEQIYQNNKNLPKKEIIKKIVNNLRNLRFYKDKSGYFFIYDMNGTVVMLPIKSYLEGMNLLHVKDVKGKYLIKEVIEALHKKDSIFKKWYYYKPNTHQILEKLGYIKYYKPLNIFIGSAIYYDNLTNEIYRRFTHMIYQIGDFNHDNILVFYKKGLLYGNKFLLSKNIYKELIPKIKKQKIFKTKINNVLLLARYMKETNLIFIEQIDLNEINELIKQQQVKLNQVVKTVITQFLLVALIFIIIVIGITLYIAKLMSNIFDKYDKELVEARLKAENAAKTKSEFLANMSHEIRTPLNAMFGFIRILDESEEDKEKKKYLNIIEKSGENLLSIINDILDFSKIESGKLNIEKIEFNPKEEKEIIYNLFKSKASEKNILLEIIEKNLKYNIISDPTRIKQIIANLLSNAIKFTDNNKKVRLIIEYDENKEELYVEVQDEGIGIPKDKLGTIFEEFSQADTSTTRKYGGTGLGLSISYRLVHLLGGELKVKSEVGKGSSFYFTIPAKKTGLAKEIVKQVTPLENIKFDYHILLVEDNQANQMFMKVILKKMGLTFDIANNGMEAIELFKNNQYDIILMDENMPEMNGIEATKKIREIERELHLEHTIIIALTANALESDKEKFILAGMDYYLSKPLDIDKLREILLKIKETNQ